ncbi:MAG: hypothetical protein GX251_01790 [Firmicutes bacterium]|nr:hypothetical protein [Bacillota bacterium]
MNVIGLEVSTSAAKSILFSLEEGVIDGHTVRYDSSVSDMSTLVPQGVVAAAKRAVWELVKKTDRKITAIGLGGVWHSLLLLDAKREPLGPIYTWADVSAGPSVDAVKQDRDFVLETYRKTGCMVHAIYPLWKYFHLQKTKPELIGQTKHISSQIEYLFQELTGERAVSKCIASGTGFFNIHTLDWDDQLLDFAGLSPDSFSELKEGPYVGSLRTSVAEELGLPAGIPVTCGFADGAMNQVGIGGDRPGIMSFSVGTSAAIRMISATPVIPETPSTWCYYLYGGKRLVGAATQGACNCVDWFLENLPAQVGTYDSLEKLAWGRSIEDAPFFLPFIYGERCPGWQDRRLGSFRDVKATHSLGDFYLAILEGVLFNVYHCYKLLTEISQEPKEILISGGIMNSQLWLQMAADIFGRTLKTTGVKDASTVGAAVVALQAIGRLKAGQGYEPESVIGTPPPSIKAAVFEQRFQRYLELYAQSSTE